MTSLLNLSLADIKDAALAIENKILTPMIHQMYRTFVDEVPSSQVFKIPGTENFRPRNIGPTDIAGEFDLVWVGSLQSQDFQVRSQRLISLMETLGSIPDLPNQLAAQGKKINWVAIAKRLWREGLGERGADSIIADMTPDEQRQFLLQQVAQALAASGGAGGRGGAANPLSPAGAEQIENEALSAVDDIDNEE